VSRKRPWLAAALAFVYPGLGHAYLRSWLRAFIWFLLGVMTAALVTPEPVVTAYESGGFSAMMTAMEDVPLRTLAPLFDAVVECEPDGDDPDAPAEWTVRVRDV